MSLSLRAFLLLATGMAAGTVGVESVSAQTAAPDIAAVDSTDSGEIVVTARKRAESVQTVPITIGVVSGEYLKNSAINDLTGLQFAVPGLSISRFEAGARASIRGVGSTTSRLGIEDSVAVHVDGVYLGFPGQSFARMFDVERIEVLSGPQGTLYGRNATAGAINVISVEPGSNFGASGQIGYGTFSTIRGNAAVDVPIGDETGLRVAGSFATNNGYTTNVLATSTLDQDFSTERFWALRGTFVTQLGDSVRLTLSSQYIRDRSNEGIALQPNPLAPATFLGWNNANYRYPVSADKKDWLSRARIDVDLSDSWKLVSITGYADYSHFVESDVGAGGQLGGNAALRYTEEDQQFTQELQIQYNSDRLNVITGLYYIDSKGSEDRIVDLFFINRPGNNDTTRTWNGKGYAAFGEANWRVVDGLRLNVGLRYNKDDKSASVFGRGPGDTAGLLEDSVSFDKLTGRLGLDYAITPDNMVYGSYSRGYKTGGVFPLALTGTRKLTIVAPETLDAYEIGSKNKLGFANMTFNVSAFYYDYKDMQVTSTVLEPALIVRVTNAAAATIKGIDMAFTIQPTKHLGLNLSGEILDAKFSRFPTFTAGGVPLDLTGKRVPRAPEASIVAAVDLLALPIVGDITLSGRVEYSYKSKIFFTQENTFLDSQDDVALLNANARLNISRALSIYVVGRNLTNTRYVTFTSGNTFAIQAQPRVIEGGIGFKF
jgi:iron complex outermembrane recepter protein